ncbi:unnamed protein product [Caenorhabditis sp. 36 PRJEB53466]|nr:unnamed protein product [Caenorhabditis sp. 36 PRJEB53466]
MKEECVKVPPVVVKAAFRDENRQAQINEAANVYITGIVGDCKSTLESMVLLPLKYHIHGIDITFRLWIKHILIELNLVIQPLKKRSVIIEEPIIFDSVDSIVHSEKVGLAVRQRINEGDAEADDPKFRMIRVEAAGTQIRGLRHLCYSLETLPFFIRNIDPGLMKHVTEDDVLNLNAVCLNSDAERFQQLIDAFFRVPDDRKSLIAFKQEIDIEKIAKRSAGRRSTYSRGFDAGRRRHAEQTKEDPNRLKLEFSAEAIELAMKVLIDVRTFFAADMNLKEEVLALCRFCLFTQIIPDLLRMIVLTAEEKDAKFIRELFYMDCDQMMPLVGELRPDMVMYWKEFPIPGHYLKVLEKVCQSIKYHRFKTMGSCDCAPFFAMGDTKVDNENIRSKWLASFLTKDGDGKEVMFDVMRSIYLWEGKLHRKRRRSSDRDPRYVHYGPVPNNHR